MKERIKFIIFVCLAVLASYFFFYYSISQRSSIPYNYYRQMEEFPFNRVSYLMLYCDLEDVLDKNRTLLDSLEKVYTQEIWQIDSLNRVALIMQSYLEAVPEVKQNIPKHEIVQVKRIASAYIMNSPAYMNRGIDNNVIHEEGRGADETTVCLIYLSNGEIIKAGLDNNSHWLGCAEGERVLKTTALEIVPEYNRYNKKLVKYTVEERVSYQPLY